MPGESIRVTLLVTHALEKAGVQYAVGGSLSSSVHGVMRSTLDADIVPDLRLEHIQPLLEAFSIEFYVDDEMMRHAIQHRGSFNLIHLETMFKVDVFIPKQREFDRLQIQRRTTQIISTDPQEQALLPARTTPSLPSWKATTRPAR